MASKKYEMAYKVCGNCRMFCDPCSPWCIRKDMVQRGHGALDGFGIGANPIQFFLQIHVDAGQHWTPTFAKNCAVLNLLPFKLHESTGVK